MRCEAKVKGDDLWERLHPRTCKRNATIACGRCGAHLCRTHSHLGGMAPSCPGEKPQVVS